MIVYRLISFIIRKGFKTTFNKIYCRGKYPLFKFLNISTIKSFYGVKLTANYSDRTHWFCVIGGYGDYLSSFLKTQKKEFIFVDIGANQGVYSLISSKIDKCIAAHAFEPVSETHEKLKKNVGLNKAAKVHAHKCAIGDECSTGEIKKFDNHSGKASLSSLNTGETDYETIEIINYEKFDSLLGDIKDLPLIIKIDTEGYEEVIIKELMKSRYWPQVQNIFFEVDEKWIDIESLSAKLKHHNFLEIFKTNNTDHYDIMVQREALAS